MKCALLLLHSYSSMVGIFIIAHAPLASAFLACLTHIYGELPARISALDITPEHDSKQWLSIARVELRRLMDSHGTLLLTDLFGATPSNIAVQLATIPQVRVLTGVNLPMLMRAINYRTESLDALADRALSGGIDSIQSIAPSA